MSFDSNMAATALRLIAKRGKTVIYTTVAQGSYDPSTGKATVVETSVTIKALVSDFTRAADGMAFMGGLVIDGDKRATFAAASLAAQPLPGDKFTVDGVIFTVQDIKVTLAGELPALYDVRGRT